MTIKTTQAERVVAKLERDGYVDNFWAIENYILRLGAIIYRLTKQGMVFDRAFGKRLGKGRHLWKDYYYTLIRRQNRVKK